MKIFKFLVLLVLWSSSAFAVQTALTVQEISETAYTQSLSAADVTNGNSVSNPNGDVFLLANCVGTCTMTLASAAASVEVPGYGPLTKSDLVVTFTTGQTKLVGPFQTRAWNTSGNLLLSYGSVVSGSVTLKALRLKPSLRN